MMTNLSSGSKKEIAAPDCCSSGIGICTQTHTHTHTHTHKQKKDQKTVGEMSLLFMTSFLSTPFTPALFGQACLSSCVHELKEDFPRPTP